MEVYLDNSATTKAYQEVAKVVEKVMVEDYGNPSSLHIKGLEAENYLTKAKEVIGRILKVKEKEIIFTSGGTESDNLALIGAARANSRAGKHIISTQIEHPAVLNALHFLEEEGFDVTYLPVNQGGIVEVASLKKALREDTILVSVMLVNNEVGTIQPVEEMAHLVKEYNANILFHCDGVQGFGKMKIHPKKWNIDMLSVSGHKIHGPKGVGFLYVNEGVKIHPILFGGEQQKNMRSGTENVPGIAGIGLASEIIYTQLDDKAKRMNELSSRLKEGILTLSGTVIHGDQTRMAPHIVSAGFSDIRSEVLLHALEEKGVYVSSGSACASNHPGISGVLRGMNVGKEYIEGTLRFSLSEYTTQEEIDYTLEILYNIVPILRRYMRR